MLSLSAAQGSRKDSTSPWKASTAELPSQGKHLGAGQQKYPVLKALIGVWPAQGSVLPLKQTRLCFFPGKEKKWFHSDQTQVSRR